MTQWHGRFCACASGTERPVSPHDGRKSRGTRVAGSFMLISSRPRFASLISSKCQEARALPRYLRSRAIFQFPSLFFFLFFFFYLAHASHSSSPFHVSRIEAIVQIRNRSNSNPSRQLHRRSASVSLVGSTSGWFARTITSGPYDNSSLSFQET